jgi:hypothetical protein
MDETKDFYRTGILAREEFCELPVSERRYGDFHASDGYRVFYQYYQIRRAGQSAEGASEPEKGGELKSRWEGSHSPFGFVWQVASSTGWTVQYILEKVNYQTLIMMLSDAPRYVDKNNDADDQSAEDEAKGIIEIFQSRLK